MMGKIFRHEVGRGLTVLLVLLALRGVYAVGLPAGVLSRWNTELVSTLSNRELNREAREALTAGYYEGILNEGSRLSSMNRLVTDNGHVEWEDRAQPDRRETKSFLFYELIPNSDIPDYRDARARYRLKTNSAGLADREYPLEKQAGVRRIAVMGDSITRGQGAPFGGNFESLLENKLNDTHISDRVRRFEVLNFAVGSYNITQQLESAVVKATPYEPDVYVYSISQLSVYRRWGHHISALLYAGIDLKYDYLRTMVKEAGLQPNDPIGVFDAKIARFRLPTIRWVLREAQAHAETHHARMLVLLVPTGNYPEQLVEPFLGVREILKELNIPTIDLLDTFADVKDLKEIRVAMTDTHPNARGHQMIFEHLYTSLSSDPALMETLLGPVASLATR